MLELIDVLFRLPFLPYAPGKGQPSFDKQYVRDYLKTLDWDKTPPGPELPAEIVAETTRRYCEIYERLTGKDWNGGV